MLHKESSAETVLQNKKTKPFLTHAATVQAGDKVHLPHSGALARGAPPSHVPNAED